ncbi:MAG TPA: hypothetical protein VHR86_00745, partial [Armatimonadota bacterium]|nr:hypothetical protein [Armatimonadota bacterium]
MKLRRTASKGLLAVALLCLSFATAFAAQSTSVPASDPAIRYVGRFGFEDAKAPWSFWSAATIKLSFQGTGLSALLKTSGSDRVQVVVDGAPTQVLALTKE